MSKEEFLKSYIEDLKYDLYKAEEEKSKYITEDCDCKKNVAIARYNYGLGVCETLRSIIEVLEEMI